jgi:hypothetical protein
MTGLIPRDAVLVTKLIDCRKAALRKGGLGNGSGSQIEQLLPKFTDRGRMDVENIRVFYDRNLVDCYRPNRGTQRMV